MAATVRITKAEFGPSARVRISKVAFFGSPGGASARVRITNVSFVMPSSNPAKIRVVKVGFFMRDALDGTPLLVEFNGESWQPIAGTLVMFDGADWVPC